MRFAALAALLLLVAQGPATAGEPSAPLTRIAFGSCADEEKPQPIWDAILRYRPELFIFAGDNVYGDVSQGKSLPDDELMDGLARSYLMAARVPELTALRSSVRHLATWDDHDYGKNDAGADFPDRRESQRLFLQFWDVPRTDPRWSRDGVYHAETFGGEGFRIQVILLDTRFFRSPLKPTDEKDAPGKESYVPDHDPSKTMLGEEQWRWLAEHLREPANLRLIVSSIQVVAEGHGWERWGNLPRERRRLYDLIRATKANGVIILSGDRHIGALYRESEGMPYPLFEMTSSGLNQANPNNREAGPNRIGAVYGAPNFGTLEVDWWARTVTLAIRSENGEVVRQERVRLDDLAAQ
jgi:alkaline phosphatase D